MFSQCWHRLIHSAYVDIVLIFFANVNIAWKIPDNGDIRWVNQLTCMLTLINKFSIVYMSGFHRLTVTHTYTFILKFKPYEMTHVKATPGLRNSEGLLWNCIANMDHCFRKTKKKNRVNISEILTTITEEPNHVWKHQINRQLNITKPKHARQ